MRLPGFSDLILVNETQQLAYRLPIRDDLVFGRSLNDCDLTLVHDSVARRHGRLHVKGDRLEVVDHGATTGVFVNGQHAARTTLDADDWLLIGNLSLYVRHISWLGDWPPRSGPLDPLDAEQRMVESFVRQPSVQITDAERDDIWWTLYGEWWRTNGDSRLFEDLWRLWTPATLRVLREGFDDQPRWFLAHGQRAFDALIAHSGLGELLGFDLLMSTPHAGQRQHAEYALSARASAMRRSLVDLMLQRLDADWPDAPRFIGHILDRAMQDRAPFVLSDLRDLAEHPRLAATVAAVVLVPFDRRDKPGFRLDHGELLGVDGLVPLHNIERVRVGRPDELDLLAWSEELASLKIVQPFDQLDPSRELWP